MDRAAGAVGELTVSQWRYITATRLAARTDVDVETVEDVRLAVGVWR